MPALSAKEEEDGSEYHRGYGTPPAGLVSISSAVNSCSEDAITIAFYCTPSVTIADCCSGPSTAVTVIG
jgi:hypothetical protein